MSHSYVIRTERLVVRPLKQCEAQVLEQRIGQTLSSSGPERFAIVLKKTHEVIGVLSLTPRSGDQREVELRIAFVSDLKERGYTIELLQAAERYVFLNRGFERVWFESAEGDGTPEKIERAAWEQALAADPTDAAYRDRQQAEASGVCAHMPKISFIRSGGQTGADRGGLDAARACGISICGWCPPKGLAEDYPKAPGLLALYPELKEGNTQGYVERTAWNVRDAHATLIVSPGGLEPLSGTEMTAIFAKRFGRPYIVLEDSSIDVCVDKAYTWLFDMHTRGITLNVAGPRESKMPGVYEMTRSVVEGLLKRVAL